MIQALDRHLRMGIMGRSNNYRIYLPDEIIASVSLQIFTSEGSVALASSCLAGFRSHIALSRAPLILPDASDLACEKPIPSPITPTLTCSISIASFKSDLRVLFLI